MSNGPPQNKDYDLWGWLLFDISAVFFIVSSLRNGDIVGLLGGIFTGLRGFPRFFHTGCKG